MLKELELLLKNVASLVKVKTIVTVWVVYIFAKLALTGAIDPADVKEITYLVIAFYFGTQYEKKAI